MIAPMPALDNQVPSQPGYPTSAAAIAALAAHDALLERFTAMRLDLVRHMMPLAGEMRTDTLPRARRRVAELPTAADLDGWYRTLRPVLDAPADQVAAAETVATMIAAIRGRPAEPALLDGYGLALAGARLSPQLVAGAAKRAIATCRVRPTPAAFLRIAEAHRAEVRDALGLVTRTMGLRRDAEKVVQTEAGART